MTYYRTRHDSWRDSTWQCWYGHVATSVHVEKQCCWVMDVFLVYHSFSFTWQGVQSPWWSLGLLDVVCAHCSFVCTSACLTCFSIRKNMSSHVLSLVHSWNFLLTCFIIHSFMNLSLHIFIPFVITSCLFMYLYLQSLMMRHHQIHKPPSLTWWMIIRFYMHMIGREDKAVKLCEMSFELGCELHEWLVKIAQRLLSD